MIRDAWRRFHGHDCPLNASGRHNYRYVANAARGVSGSGYTHAQLHRCACGAEQIDEYEIEELR